MVAFAFCLLISVLISFGMAVAIVEKGKEWPIKKYNILIRSILHKLHWKAPFALYCTTCTSFWTTLLSDLILCWIAYFNGYFYFLWPFSGFATVGFTWFIVEYLNAIDQDTINNNYIVQEDKNNKWTI